MFSPVFEKLSWAVRVFDVKSALLPAVSAIDCLLLVFLEGSSNRMASNFWDLPGTLIGSFPRLFLNSGQSPSTPSSCIEGIIRSGSALARAEVRGVLLRGVSAEVEDRWDCLTASTRVGLAELDIAGGSSV